MNCPECKRELEINYKREDNTVFYKSCKYCKRIENFVIWETENITYTKIYELKELKNDKCPECKTKLKRDLESLGLSVYFCNCGIKITKYWRSDKFIVKKNYFIEKDKKNENRN